MPAFLFSPRRLPVRTSLSLESRCSPEGRRGTIASTGVPRRSRDTAPASDPNLETAGANAGLFYLVSGRKNRANPSNFAILLTV
jgi:hypothetical protein